MNKKGLIFAGTGFELVGMVLAGYFLGTKLDEFFGKKGVYVGVCIMGFMALWTFHFVFLLKKFMDDPDNQLEDDEDPADSEKK